MDHFVGCRVDELSCPGIRTACHGKGWFLHEDHWMGSSRSWTRARQREVRTRDAVL